MSKIIIKDHRLLLLILIVLPLISFFISLALGRYEVPFCKVIGITASRFLPLKHYWPQIDENIVINLRFPRILLAMLIGAGLSVSGATFQGIFKNPLVSPHILGVAAGAGFGGILAMMLFNHPLLIFISAFIFGIVAMIGAFFISRVGKSTPILMLVLSGVIINAFFQAMISLLKYIADPMDQLPAIVFWLMGSLLAASYRKLAMVAIPIIVCIILLFLLRWRINILSLEEDDARALGIDVEKTKWLIITLVTIIVSLSVSVCGIIGWVGLAVPHISRMLVGPDHQVLIPTSISLGAAYLVCIDTIARTITPAEIPLGILTAIIGAPIFGYLLKKTYGGGWIGG